MKAEVLVPVIRSVVKLIIAVIQDSVIGIKEINVHTLTSSFIQATDCIHLVNIQVGTIFSWEKILRVTAQNLQP